MIRIITNDGSKYVFNDVYDVKITADSLKISYQQPYQEAYINTLKLDEIIYLHTTEPLTIKFNVGGLYNES